MIDEGYYRAFTVVFFVTAMSVSIYFRSRAARQDSNGSRDGASGPAMLVMRLAFVFGLLGFLVTYAVKPEWTNWASMPLLDAVRILGGFMVVVTIPCFFWLFRHLGKNVTPTANTRLEHSLIITGPYRWVRHPMYTAGIAFWMGMSLFAAKWFLLLFVGAAFVFLMLRTPREEANLQARFGDAYDAYRLRTGRYLPKVFPAGHSR